AGGHRAGEAVRVPDRDDELSHAKVLGVAEDRRSEVASLGAQYGEVGERVRPDDLDADLAPVHEGGADPGCAACDHVCGGEHEAVRCDDDAAPAAVQAPATSHAAG